MPNTRRTARQNTPSEPSSQLPGVSHKKPKIQRGLMTNTIDKEVTEKHPSYCWADAGENNADGTVHHFKLDITGAEGSFRVERGDTVLLRSGDVPLSRLGAPLAPPSKSFVARIEHMWEKSQKKRSRVPDMKIRVRWFLEKQDIEGLTGNFTGPISRQKLLQNMSSRDVVWSDQWDDNEVSTILDKCQIILRRPSLDPLPSLLPDRVFLYRYSISFGSLTNRGTAVVTAYDGPNDPWPEKEPDNNDSSVASSSRMDSRKFGTDSQEASSESSSSSDEESSDEDSVLSRERGLVTEGSTTKGNINIGRNYQVVVPPFNPTLQVKSRKPVKVWEPSSILSEEARSSYLSRVADILVPFLKENHLLAEEPYSPLPVAQVEAAHVAAGDPKPPTLSSMSTASSLPGTGKGSRLTRECKVDAILAVLHEKEYNVQLALDAIAQSPRDYLTIWTKTEKEIFISGFRRYSGSLRMISKGLAPSKNFKDVVDFHYRFKIPDQFRRYQAKKREQALRMMKCIEERRYHDSIAAPRNESDNRKIRKDKSQEESGLAKRAGDWPRLGSSDVVGSVEERRVAARDLYLEVQSVVGSEKLMLLASAVKSLRKRPVEDLKETLVETLQDHPDLLERFMAFLPRRFRN